MLCNSFARDVMVSSLRCCHGFWFDRFSCNIVAVVNYSVMLLPCFHSESFSVRQVHCIAVSMVSLLKNVPVMRLSWFIIFGLFP